MKKIASLALIMILFLVVIVTVSFISGQDTKNTRNLAIKGENRKNMKSLTVKNDLQKHGIEVVAPTDFNFDAELMQYIGNYNEVTPLVDAAKPFAVFIKNNSLKEVVGISLRWEFVKSNGEINKVNQTETNPGVLMGMKPLDPWMVGKTSLINSNSHRFISYFYGITEQLSNAFKSNSYKRFEYKLGPEKAQDYISDAEYQKEMILRDVSSVSVVIDAIIFNDGTFVGENQSFLFETMSAILQAKRDFLKKLRGAKQSRKSDTDGLNEFISEMKSIPAEKRRPTLNYLDGKDAFDQTYKYKMIGFMDEISRKRSRVVDSQIVKDFLAVEDSDFIDLKRE